MDKLTCEVVEVCQEGDCYCDNEASLRNVMVMVYGFFCNSLSHVCPILQINRLHQFLVMFDVEMEMR